MTPWITRVEAVTAAGRGLERLSDALAAGVPLSRPVPYATADLGSPFAALAGLPTATELLDEVVRAIVPDAPCGLVVGTASGAISGPFEAWRTSGGEEQAWRQWPTAVVAQRNGLQPHLTVSVACASSTAAFEVARGWLRAGRCERVIVAGVDALSLFVHAGFAGLGALAAGPSRPFQAARDGLLLGDGAAAFLLETPASAVAAGRSRLVSLLGCGLAQDGVHLTAPDRTGAGVERALRAALSDALLDPDEVATLSAHATGTRFNDAMEAQAYGRVFPGGVPLHAIKPIVGHTLGAAGAVAAAAAIAFLRGASAPTLSGALDVDCPMTVVPARPGRAAITTTAAFGGVNAVAIFGDGEGRPSESRAVRVLARHACEGDEWPPAALGVEGLATLGRTDSYVRAGIAALAAVRDGLDPTTAVVLSSQSNCRQADHRFFDDLRSKGASRASRIHFTYTTPGSPLAEAAIRLGLRGPALVLCGDAEDGRREAERLVAQGVVIRAVALHVEAPDRFATAAAVVLGSA